MTQKTKTTLRQTLKTDKFDDFLDLAQFLKIWPDSVLIELKVVRNNAMNNFEFVLNSRRYTVFIPRASEVGKI